MFLLILKIKMRSMDDCIIISTTQTERDPRFQVKRLNFEKQTRVIKMKIMRYISEIKSDD